MKYLLLIFFFSIICFNVSSQKSDSCSNELKGVIYAIDTKEALPHVRVRVKGTEKVVFSDDNGFFKVSGLCDKSNTLILTCFGYCDTICDYTHEHSKDPHIYIKQRLLKLDEITIFVDDKVEEGTVSIAQETINKEDLSADFSQSLASAVSELEGVTFTSTGNNVQLPVIHGLYGNRILVLNNGFKHGFQNWGTDHAPEIDVASASSITVVKGAAGVRFGPEALGGAIIVNSDPLYLKEPLKAIFRSGYQTNGRAYFVNTELSQGLKNLSYHIGGNFLKSGDRKSPDYSLTNSGKQEESMNLGLRYNQKKWDVRLYYSLLNQDLALLRSSIANSGNAFVQAINSDQPTFIRSFSYQIQEPNQLTTHHLGKVEVDWYYSDHAKLTMKIGKQLNQRKEYDVRRNAQKPIIDLDLTTDDYQIEWKHPDWFKLDGLFGIQLFSQQNNNNPGTGTTPFIPNYKSNRFSTFLIESYEREKNTYEIGVRLDFEKNNVSGREESQDIFNDTYSFRNITSTLGFVRHLNDNSTFRTNIGTAWRTPNMAELFSFGQHGFKSTYGLLRYQFIDNQSITTDGVQNLGQSNVSPEKGYKWVSELSKQKNSNAFLITIYSHFIENYIFERPYGVFGTVRGPMPVFIIGQSDAFFAGTDFSWKKDWSRTLHGNFGIGYLWSKNVGKNEPLINQPPMNTSYKLDLKLKSYRKIIEPQVSLKSTYTFKQFQAPRTIRPEDLISGQIKIDSESQVFDFRDAPSGYFLFDLSLNFQISQFKFNMAVQNLLNTRYRNYLNEMRYFADEIGRNFTFTIVYTLKPKSKTK